MGIAGRDNLNGFLDLGVPYAGFCVLTDKRIYFDGGDFYRRARLGYKERGRSYTVELDAVKDCRFVSIRLIYLALSALADAVGLGCIAYFYCVIANFLFPNMFSDRFRANLTLIAFLLIFGAIFINGYLKKHEMLEVRYAGGRIALPVSSYEREELDAFRAELNKVLDARRAVPAEESHSQKESDVI